MARLIDELLVRDWRFPAGAAQVLPPAEARTLRARIPSLRKLSYEACR